MFLQLDHTDFPIFHAAKALVLETYRISNRFPLEERYNLTSQVRRAALSVHLNICEGLTRKSKRDRRRFFEVSRGSVVEVDTAFDIAVELRHAEREDLRNLGDLVSDCFYQLTALIRSLGEEE